MPHPGSTPATGQSPFFLMFGRRARIPVDLLCGTGDAEKDVSVNSYVSQRSRILEAAYHQVQNRMGLQQDRQKEIYDRRRHAEPFKQGDYVMLYTSVVPRGRCRKLLCPWSGPYKILKKLSEVTDRIRCCQGGRKSMVVHFNRLILCPTNVRSSSYCPQDASYSGKLDGAARSPVGTETCSSGGQVLLIPDDDNDDDERVIDSSVLAAESLSTMDDGNTSSTETTDSTSPTETTDSTLPTGTADSASPTWTTGSTSPTGTTESTSIAESAPTTEETPVTDQMPFGMQSSTTRYPSWEHQSPSRYI